MKKYYHYHLTPIYVLSEKKFDGALNLPVIKIDFLEFEVDLSSFDALVFTSKNGVEAIDRIDKKWKDKEIYSIGTGTTKAIKEKGVQVTYTAKSSYGDDFAKEIGEKLLGKSVLFPRAKVVTSHLNKILQDVGVDLREVIAYETVCNSEDLLKPEKGSVIIFSSPSTIECFFKKFAWDESYKAVVIGKKTASFIPKEIKYTLSQRQTIPDCIKLGSALLYN